MTERSAAGFTVVVSVAVLSPVLGSATLLPTLAALVMVLTAVGLTTMLTVTLSPLAMAPRVQVTVPPASVQPADAEAKLAAAGRVSVRVTAVPV